MALESRVVAVMLLLIWPFFWSAETHAQLPISPPLPAKEMGWQEKDKAQVVIQALEDGGLLIGVGADIARVKMPVTMLNVPGMSVIARWLRARIDLPVATLTRLNTPDVSMVTRWLLPLQKGRLLAVGASGQVLMGGPKAKQRRPLRHLGALKRISVLAAGVDKDEIVLVSKDEIIRLSEALAPSPMLAWPGGVDAVVWCPGGPTAIDTRSSSEGEALKIMRANFKADTIDTQSVFVEISPDLSSDFLSNAKTSSMICDGDRLIALLHDEDIFGLLNVNQERATLRPLRTSPLLHQKDELTSLVWLLGPHLQHLDLKENRIILWPIDKAGALGASVEVATPGVQPVLPRCASPSGSEVFVCAYVAADAEGASALWLSTPKGALPLKFGADEPFFNGIGWDAYDIDTLVRDPLLAPDERLERAIEAYCQDESPVCDKLSDALKSRSIPWLRGFAIIKKQERIAFRIDHCTLVFDLITKDEMKILEISCSEPTPCGHKAMISLKDNLKTQVAELNLKDKASMAIDGLSKSKCCHLSSDISEEQCHEHIIDGSWLPLSNVPVGFILRIDNSGGPSDCSDIVMHWTGAMWWLRTANTISCD